MKTIWTVVLAAAAAWGQSVYTGTSSTTGAAAWPGGGSGGIVCGPPNYNCSRTDLNAQQLPSTIPSMGGGSNPPLTGAGMIVLDDLNNANRIVRCTDAAFDPNTPNKGYTAGPGGSGDENIWNADSTMLFLQSTGAVGYPVAFNSSTLQCSRIYTSQFPSTGGMTVLGEGSWAYANRNVLDLLKTALIQKYDFTDWLSGSQTNPPSAVNLFDYTETTSGLPNFNAGNCLPSGYANAPWSVDATHSKDDQTFGAAFSFYSLDWTQSAAFGLGVIIRPTVGNSSNSIFRSSGGTSGATEPNPWPSTLGATASDGTITWTNVGSGTGQGTGTKVAAYRVGSGCTTLDTSTGAIQGDWGATGTANLPDRFTIHNSKISKDGNWLVITPTTCLSSTCSNNQSPYAWQIGTLNLIALAPAGHNGGGHWTEGYTHWINHVNSPIGQQTIRTFTSPLTESVIFSNGQIPSGLVAPFDLHQNWSNVDANDTRPIFMSTHSSLTTYPAGWYNEVLSANPATGVVHRFTHTFTDSNSQIFNASQAIGGVSQDGKYYVFTSDWMGNLGSTSGATTCTVGTDCRSDAFVVELR